MVDWQKERSQFPCLEKFTYFISAARTPISTEVYEANKKVLDQLHTGAWTNWEKTSKSYHHIKNLLSELFGGKSEDWGLGANSSHNMNLIASFFENKGDFLSFEDEFPSSTIPWLHQGFNLRKIPSLEGRLPVEYILNNLRVDTQAVIISHVQFSTGFRTDLKSLGAALKERKIPLVVNATQSLGALPLNIEEMNISALVCSCHKWLGTGYGLSLLFLSPNLRKNKKFPHAGHRSYSDTELKGELINPTEGTSFMELGSSPLNQMMGLEISLLRVKRLGIESISKKILDLTESFERLVPMDKLLFKKHSLSEKSGISYISHPRASQITTELEKNGILINERKGNLRVSNHFFNNEEDLQKLVLALKDNE